MKKILLYLSLSLFLNSCAVQVKTVDLKRRIYEDVPLNTILKNEIGDRLITAGEEDYQDAIRILELPYNEQNSTNLPYKNGDILLYVESYNEWNLFYNKIDVMKNSSNDNRNNYQPAYLYGIAVNKKDKGIIKPFIRKDLGAIKIKKDNGFKVNFEIFVDNNCSNCFKQEFIFNGKVGNNLKFVYREYINDMARPAFNQDLQYDLNESNVVGFKGLRLEIINATNTNIEYKILSSFNKIK